MLRALSFAKIILIYRFIFVRAQTSVSFSFTGSHQTFIVPENVNSILVLAAGASSSGYGGCMTAKIPVTTGETLYILVGGTPGSNGSPGYNGGGRGSSRTTRFGTTFNGGGGGGATDIRSSLSDLASRLVVAGGGGGGGQAMGIGGNGGGVNGDSAGYGWNCNGGGATSSTGGAGCGGAPSGTFGTGGDGANCFNYYGGAGGGGWYGGGGGCAGPGGGGSGYAQSGFVSSSNGCNNGNGQLTITYDIVLSSIIPSFDAPSKLPSLSPTFTTQPTLKLSFFPSAFPSGIPTSSLTTLVSSSQPSLSPTTTAINCALLTKQASLKPTLWFPFNQSTVDIGIYSSCTNGVKEVGALSYSRDGSLRNEYFAFFNNPGNSASMSSNYLIASTFYNAPLTITAWIRTDLKYSMTALGLCKAAGFTGYGDAYDGIQIDIDTAGRVSVALALPSLWTVIISSSGVIQPNIWFHIAVTVTSSFVCTLYINGAPLGSGIGTGNLNHFNNLIIGGSGDGYRGFYGHMKGVKMYNYALLQDQILLYEAIVSYTCPATSRSVVTVYPVSYYAYAWNNFMNSYAVWINNVNNPLVGISQLAAFCVYAPYYGNYNIRISADDHSDWYFDGLLTLSTGLGTYNNENNPLAVKSIYLSQGYHLVLFNTLNICCSKDWYSNPGGWAATISDFDNTLIWDTRNFQYIYSKSLPSASPTQPSSQPSSQPSRQPISQPSKQPSRQPYNKPLSNPTKRPIKYPTQQPFGHPSRLPSAKPSKQPQNKPSKQPSFQPSYQPIIHPSKLPSSRPSEQPSFFPSRQPFYRPTLQLTTNPTSKPSHQPSRQPSLQPYHNPSRFPSARPSKQPQNKPSKQPTLQPSYQPIIHPSKLPSCQPWIAPSTLPSSQPNLHPISHPTKRPTEQPSSQPYLQPSSLPSFQPLQRPTKSPTLQPIVLPSQNPIVKPSNQPSLLPKTDPTIQPNNRPLHQPSRQPSCQPSHQPFQKPTGQPTVQPIYVPSTIPSKQPSLQPIKIPTKAPIASPTKQPSSQPNNRPISLPSLQPIFIPTIQPYYNPTNQPSRSPSTQPFMVPTIKPSLQPYGKPNIVLTLSPTSQPSRKPTVQILLIPTSIPSFQPIEKPTNQPNKRPYEIPIEQPSNHPSSVRHSSYRLNEQPSGLPSQQPSQKPSFQPSEQPIISSFNKATEKIRSSSSIAPILISLCLLAVIIIACYCFIIRRNKKDSKVAVVDDDEKLDDSINLVVSNEDEARNDKVQSNDEKNDYNLDDEPYIIKLQDEKTADNNTIYLKSDNVDDEQRSLEGKDNTGSEQNDLTSDRIITNNSRSMEYEYSSTTNDNEIENNNNNNNDNNKDNQNLIGYDPVLDDQFVYNEDGIENNVRRNILSDPTNNKPPSLVQNKVEIKDTYSIPIIDDSDHSNIIPIPATSLIIPLITDDPFRTQYFDNSKIPELRRIVHHTHDKPDNKLNTHSNLRISHLTNIHINEFNDISLNQNVSSIKLMEIENEEISVKNESNNLSSSSNKYNKEDDDDVMEQNISLHEKKKILANVKLAISKKEKREPKPTKLLPNDILRDHPPFAPHIRDIKPSKSSTSTPNIDDLKPSDIIERIRLMSGKNKNS